MKDMLSWWKKKIEPPMEFRIHRAFEEDGSVQVRQYRSEDRDACLELYSVNEIRRFPKGGISEYEEFLNTPSYLILVLELEGKVVATGGIACIEDSVGRYAWLSYGLVKKELHGRGLGTLLLLSRLSALKSTGDSWPVLLIGVWRSQGFYEKFGFKLFAKLSPETPPVSGILGAFVSAESLDRIKGLGNSSRVIKESRRYIVPISAESHDESYLTVLKDYLLTEYGIDPNA